MRERSFWSYIFAQFLIVVVGACAPTGQLGGQNDHRFFSHPKKLVIIQIPGLSNELLAFLKISRTDANWVSQWETVACTGVAWAFNLYALRPGPYESTMSTLLGSPNITPENKCSLTEKVPVWAPFQALGHDVHIIERGVAEKDSLKKLFECPQNLWDFSKLSFWIMAQSPSPQSAQFHFQQNKTYDRGQFYYDRSCNENGCFSSLEQNLELISKQIEIRNKFFNVLIVRDWTLWKAINSKDFKSIMEELKIWDYLVRQIIDRTISEQGDGTVVVTGDASIPIELPLQGNDWKDVLNTGKGMIIHRPSVYTPFWVWGAKAEKFCGIFQQAEFPRRLL